MFRKSYTIKLESGKPLKDGQIKVYILVTFDRKKFHIPSSIKVPEKNFEDGKIIKLVNAKENNAILTKERNEVEKILNEAIFNDLPITKELFDKSENKGSFDEFIEKHIKQNEGKLSEGRIKHYKSIQKKIKAFNPRLKFKDIDQNFLHDFEAFIRLPDKDKNIISGNTVSTNIKIVKTFLNKAVDLGHIAPDALKGYKNPKYLQKIPVYLSEEEINSFENSTIGAGSETVKMCGYYFLLSCFTGYRISDLMAFDYKTAVHGNKITVRAKKNKTIVSIPIYPRLKSVLEYCKTVKLDISEQHFRKHVKTIAGFASIKKEITPHVGRHSFAMLMISKGLSVDEVAELLGDSAGVAKIYARITSTHLSNRIMQIMG